MNHNKEVRINNASNTTKGEYDALLVQEKVHKSIKLWMFYCDLEESISPENARIVYERILDLRIATPQIILNYAAMLQESKFFEDSFHVYERGVNLFKFPHSIDIWRAYLTQFVDRFQDKKVERARDLFEQCCEQAPPKDCKEFFLEYAKLEEQFGLSKRAMDIYDQALTKMKSASDKIEVLDIYVKRAMDFFGVGKVRSIYEKIIDDDDDDDDTTMMTVRQRKRRRRIVWMITRPKSSALSTLNWRFLSVKSTERELYTLTRVSSQILRKMVPFGVNGTTSKSRMATKIRFAICCV